MRKQPDKEAYHNKKRDRDREDLERLVVLDLCSSEVATWKTTNRKEEQAMFM